MQTTRLLTITLLPALCASVMTAQSVTISPSGYLAVPLAGATQFTATATGLSSPGVTWSVAGNAAIYGSISATGLYSAPAAAPANPAQIVATSVVPPATKATQYVYFLSAGPTLAQVAPNPIPTGSSTVTLTGVGFQKGATVQYNAAGGARVQASTSFVNSTTLKAGVYFAAATTASIYAVNPGSGPSNTVTVPVGSAATYTLTVVNGAGSGSYAAGAVVAISANAPPSGQAFSSWTGAAVANSSAASTTITMPAASTVVTANYSGPAHIAISPSGYVAIPTGSTVQFTATVTGVANTAVTWSVAGSSAANGSISAGGLYMAPATVPPNAPQITATSVASPGTSAVQYIYFLTPGPVLMQVSPNPLPSGTTTVTFTGTGFQKGAEVVGAGAQLATTYVSPTTVTASSYLSAGTTVSFYVVNPGSSPSNTIAVPVSGPASYALTVVNGSGSGTYTAGTPVTIAANAAPAGQAFLNWTGANVTNSTATSTTIVMPAGPATVTANFGTPPTTYPLTVINGSGSGNYPAGNIVNIDATVLAGQTFQNWTGATVANPNAAATTITMPAAATSIMANVVGQTFTLTVVNGTGSGIYAAGASVSITANAAPPGQYFQTWTGPGVANANQPATAITLPAANTTVTANFYAPPPVPFPVTTHPRLWVTPADVTRLRGWATSSNSVYQAYTGLVNQAVANYNSAFPGAGLTARNPVPASPYPDFGDVQGYTGMLSEENAMILAFQSLIDPSLANRQQYAQAARNLIMYGFNQAALGHLSNAPFRDPEFMVYNRGSATGHEWPLVIDWIYDSTDAGGNPILTAADKATVQQVFLMWSNDCVNASTTGGDSPQVHGVLNSLQLLPNNQPYRMASNNYYLAHARVLTMMGLTLDPADDPAIHPAVAPSAVGNTERSYILEGNGAWLYQIWAMMGEPAAVAQAYGIPNNPNGAGFGLASGGLPPEGMLYGESFAYVLGQLLALQTSGFNDPALAGPQIRMIGSPVWDRYVTGFVSSLTPQPFIPPTESYLGSIYQYAGYGDLLRTYATPDFMRPFALLALLDQENGQTSHLNAARWFSVDAVEGGSSQLLQRVNDPWTWGATSSLLYVMLLDPNAPAATDPRPTYPTMFYDAPAARVLAHTDWTPNATLFDYRASWISINHQDGNGGMFELYRKGEWLTKEMSNYDNGGGGNGATTEFHNALAMENWCQRGVPQYLNGVDVPAWTNGSQWMEGVNAGDPTTITSNGTANGSIYVYAASDLTNLFNRPEIWSPQDAAMDVTQSTRSVLWLNNVAASDYIVVYDRGTTVHTGLFKRFNLALVKNPAVNGNTVTETMPDGQHLFVQTLLPLTPSITSFDGAVTLNSAADLEPTQYILQVQDPNDPADTRFLHVLQGADAGTAMAAAAYRQSTAGTAFDGAQFASVAVYFPVSTSAGFTGTTLPAPAGVHTVLVTGLTPGAGYSVTFAQNAIAVASGGNLPADAAGVLVISF